MRQILVCVRQFLMYIGWFSGSKWWRQFKELNVIGNDFRTNQKRFGFVMSTQLFCEGHFFPSNCIWNRKIQTCVFTFFPLTLFKSPSFSVQFQLEERFQLKIPYFQLMETFFTTERTQGLGDLYLIFCLLEKKEKSQEINFFLILFPTSVPNMYLSHLFNVPLVQQFGVFTAHIGDSF